jgi:hypothetical protein
VTGVREEGGYNCICNSSSSGKDQPISTSGVPIAFRSTNPQNPILRVKITRLGYCSYFMKYCVSRTALIALPFPDKGERGQKIAVKDPEVTLHPLDANCSVGLFFKKCSVTFKSTGSTKNHRAPIELQLDATIQSGNPSNPSEKDVSFIIRTAVAYPKKQPSDEPFSSVVTSSLPNSRLPSPVTSPYDAPSIGSSSSERDQVLEMTSSSTLSPNNESAGLVTASKRLKIVEIPTPGFSVLEHSMKRSLSCFLVCASSGLNPRFSFSGRESWTSFGNTQVQASTTGSKHWFPRNC